MTPIRWLTCLTVSTPVGEDFSRGIPNSSERRKGIITRRLYDYPVPDKVGGGICVCACVLCGVSELLLRYSMICWYRRTAYNTTGMILHGVRYVCTHKHSHIQARFVSTQHL